MARISSTAPPQPSFPHVMQYASNPPPTHYICRAMALADLVLTGTNFQIFCQCCAVRASEEEIEPVTGCPARQPRQPEAALPALLEAGSVAVLAAGADPRRHDAIDVQGGAEGEASVSPRDKLELLWKTQRGQYCRRMNDPVQWLSGCRYRNSFSCVYETLETLNVQEIAHGSGSQCFWVCDHSRSSNTHLRPLVRSRLLE